MLIIEQPASVIQRYARKRGAFVEGVRVRRVLQRAREMSMGRPLRNVPLSLQ